MPFIPHTDEDIKAMLEAIGVSNIAALFDEVPSGLPRAALEAVPEGLNEQAMMRLMLTRQPSATPGTCFIGAGAYEHHIPAAVWEIATRGEYYTAYTPYQAEASQGSLQLIYEYQTMMARLMGMEVSNASMYDGATALAESVLMAVRIQRGKKKRVLVPGTIHPHYRKVLQTVLKQQAIDLVSIPYDVAEGRIDFNALKKIDCSDVVALIVAQPNFFGGIEAVDALTDWAHERDALVIAQVNPTAMALLKEPGSWGERGADIVCGEGQPLGVPLASGGPYFGFMCCNQVNVRQLPGRLVGRSHDANGREGFTLTLQAREQHIRRGKATSNICTNQGLVVAAATIYLSLVGAVGLREVAAASHHRARSLFQKLCAIEGVESVFSQPTFHEFVIRLSKPMDQVVKAMAQAGIQAGFCLTDDYPELGECLLVCATETKTEEDLNHYQQTLSAVLESIAC